MEYAKLLAPQIVDSMAYMHEAIGRGARVLIEGANAALLDIDFGTFPYAAPAFFSSLFCSFPFSFDCPRTRRAAC